ncbi:Signal recognition particle receptor subunit alpha [Lamellibrachia satsuma]|nr:Signal recognition particle receptor subunit alpha [Lamellibrachia satsuma]
MLDFFSIFSKGGIVLWCFQGTAQSFTASVNALIKSVILQERGGNNSFSHEALTLKYRLDNEFELVFVVAYQKILQLSYMDKFLSDIECEFRNKYKDDLRQGMISRNFDFSDTFRNILQLTEDAHKLETQVPRKMRTFEESLKSKKTVASMIESTNKETPGGKKKAKSIAQNREKPASQPAETVAVPQTNGSLGGELDDETIQRNRAKLFGRKKTTPKSPKEPTEDNTSSKKKGKEKRVWGTGNSTRKDMKNLDFSGEADANGIDGANDVNINVEEQKWIGQMAGALKDMESESSSEEEEEEEEVVTKKGQSPAVTKKKQGFGLLSGLKNLVGSKALSTDDVRPALEKVKEQLIAKNVAADIADKLCESIRTKLEGRVLGTFTTIASTVKQTLYDSCVQILSPHRRVNILRDAMEAKQQRRPYTVVFCGVNGVGKSTNLAKVTFWLVENGFRVLIAACDTFRAGAVEQLRTHTRKLNALHPPEKHSGLQMVQLYEKGYGKDAAGIAMEAINFARDTRVDIVLVDTAGRMQDNEPLMRALAKLITVNQPDLVLFVGEALVGNEAVDQLVKFNQALADHSNRDEPRLIDGILLTKFDTIDDKVGAAISMTYVTGQPVVFVGTGQTYTDLRNLNAKAVVNALLKG